MRARKRRILGAASRAFRKKGFHEAGMRDIAAACGMTVGNLYYYFKNKQELLAFCQEDAASRLLAAEFPELRKRCPSQLRHGEHGPSDLHGL